MKKYAFGVLACVILLWGHWGKGVPPVFADTPEMNPSSSDLSDQTGVALTIYNANLGLVKDQREISLAPGTWELRFMDVAAKIIPSTVHIRSLVDPQSLSVLEQNYEYDLLNPQKLLDKYVGKEVRLYSKNPYTEREEMVTATLLSNNGGPIFQIGDTITFGHPGRILFPGVPENLISKPTLVWLLKNTLPVQKIEATYLTEGITWRADYVMTLNAADDRSDLSGWVTVDNQSGTTYPEAELKLVAGDVNRVQDQRFDEERIRRKAELAAVEEAPQFKEEAFFEYHIYTLQRASTIKNNQTKQIRLFTAENVPVKKELILQGTKYFYYGRRGGQDKQKVGVFVQIENRKENHMGMPLPKGVVRVYKHDSDGGLQFVGEDRIDHTPKDEKIQIKLGEAFDVVGVRKQTDWKKLASDTYEAAFEISLRNHKKEDVTVSVIEPIPGDWRMLDASHDHEKSDAFAAKFRIPVSEDKEVILTYRVRMRF